MRFFFFFLEFLSLISYGENDEYTRRGEVAMLLYYEYTRCLFIFCDATYINYHIITSSQLTRDNV